jgi:predicted kinase
MKTKSCGECVGGELVLIRGLPGSGKSMMARIFALIGFEHFEADAYRELHPDAGNKEAHAWCLKSAEEALARGGRVVVSNTFTRLWEIEPYFEMGRRLAGGSTLIVARGKWKSVHPVPQDVLDNMRLRWEEIEAYESGVAA